MCVLFAAALDSRPCSDCTFVLGAKCKKADSWRGEGEKKGKNLIKKIRLSHLQIAKSHEVQTESIKKFGFGLACAKLNVFLSSFFLTN